MLEEFENICQQEGSTVKKFSTYRPLRLGLDDALSYYPFLLTKDEIHVKYPWTENRLTYPSVFTSYREPNFNGMTCCVSLFTAHNELVNSWTHILGTCLAISLLCIGISTLGFTPGAIVIGIYCAIGFAMFFFSATFHTFGCHSDDVSRNVLCLDWFGVTLMIFGSNLIGSYFELRSSPVAFGVFTALNVLFGVFTYYVTFSSLQKVFNPKKNENEGKESKMGLLGALDEIMQMYIFRIFVGIAFAVGLILAWLIGYAINGTANDRLGKIFGVYGCYATVILQVFNIPEGLYPGKFDIWGSSHQLFHCGIVGGFFLLWYTYYSVESSFP